MSRRSIVWSWAVCQIVWAGSCLVQPGHILGQDSKGFEFELVAKTLVRSGPAVWSLAISPDQKWIAAGREDGRILVRDAIDNQLRHVLEGHTGLVSAVAFSPSGEFLASAGHDGEVRLWHRDKGELRFTLAGHKNWITCLAYSPDGRFLVTGGYDKMVRLWHADTGQPAHRLEGHTGTVRSAAFSPDGKTLATAGDDGVIRFWNADTGEQEEPLSLEAGSLRAIAFSPDGQSLLIAPENEKIRIWDRKSKTTRKEFTAVSPDETDTTPMSAAYCPDGISVIVSTRGGRARVWSAESGTLLQSLNGHEDSVSGVALAPDGKTLFTGGLDGKVLAWPALLPLKPALAKFSIGTGDVWALSLSPAGKTLAVGGKGGFVELWDLTTGQRTQSLEGFDGTVDCLEYSADGKLLVAAGWRVETVTVWDTETGEIKAAVDTESKVQSIALSPDGQRLAVGHKPPQKPEVFSLTDAPQNLLKNALILEGHELSVYGIAFSPDGTKIASCSGEWTERKPGRVLIHEASTGSKLAQFDDHTHAVRSLVFAADGSKLFSLSQDGVLKIYEMSGLRESATLKNGLDSRAVAATAGGRQVAVGLQNGNVNLWNLERRAIEHRLEGTDDLFSLRFSPDGSLLFGADGNSFVQIWKLSEGPLAAMVESWLHRPASAESPQDTNPKETP